MRAIIAIEVTTTDMSKGSTRPGIGAMTLKLRKLAAKIRLVQRKHIYSFTGL